MALRRRNNTDGAQRRVFDVLSLLGARVQGRLLRGSFEWWYRRPDPWGAGVSDYDRERFARTLELIPHRPYRRILDVGCGEGLFTRRLADRHPGARVLGVDISERAVERAREGAAQGDPRISFAVRDILNEAPSGTFDLVFCAETLYYLGRDARVRAAAERMSELVEPGGVLVLTHPLPEAERLHEPFGALLDLVADHDDDGSSFRPYKVSLYERPRPPGRKTL